MRGDDRASAVAPQEPPSSGDPGQREPVWNLAGGDEGSGGQATVPADLVADTVEALQARRGDGDRDALRGTLDPSPRDPRSRARAAELRRD